MNIYPAPLPRKDVKLKLTFAYSNGVRITKIMTLEAYTQLLEKRRIEREAEKQA